MAALQRAKVEALLVAQLALLAPGAAPARADEAVDLRPESAAAPGLARWLAALRPDAAREPRRLRVETSPPGAELAAFYARDGVQLRSARGDAPLELIVPSRAETRPGDSITVEARLPGHRTGELVVPAGSADALLRLALAPLPNRIVAAWLLELAGRARLTLLSAEPLAARIEATPRGWRVVASDTALEPSASAALRAAEGRALRGIEARALGEDALLELEAPAARAAGAELRSSTQRERVRPLHRYTLDLVPADGGAAAAAALTHALAELAPRDVAGCAAEFDRALRAALDPAALARALAPADDSPDGLVAMSLRRLGELAPDHSLHMLDGTTLAAGLRVELLRALAQPEQSLGLLAVLRAVVARVEPAPGGARAFAALVAPELPLAEREGALAQAERAERLCSARP